MKLRAMGAILIVVMAFGGVRVGCAERAEGRITISKINYRGWPGAYRLTNGTVDLVFVPQVGRIMRFGAAGGPNVLWNNPDLLGKTTDLSKPVTDWPNYGGDKLWPAPQSVWGWPPDATFESAPHRVQVLPNQHLRITSPVSEKHGIQFVREIAMETRVPNEVVIKNTLVNKTDKPLKWGVWEIAQTDDPARVSFPANTKASFPQGFHIFGDTSVASPVLPAPERVTVDKTTVRIVRDRLKSQKIGGDTPEGWIEAEYRSGPRFRISAPRESGGTYPDDGCNLEVYASADPAKYVEMELLAPLRTLAPNQKTTFVTRWSLVR